MKKRDFIFCAAITALCYLTMSLMFYSQTELIGTVFGEIYSYFATGWVDLFQGIGIFLMIFLLGRNPSMFGNRIFHAGCVAAMLPAIFLSVLVPIKPMIIAMLVVLNLLVGMCTSFYFSLIASFVQQGKKTLCFAVAYAVGSLGTWLISELGSNFLTSPAVLIADTLLVVGCVALVMLYRSTADATFNSARDQAKPFSWQRFFRDNTLLLITIALMTAVSTIGSPDNLLFTNGTTLSLVAVRAPYGIGLIVAALIYEYRANIGSICTLASLIYPLLATMLLRTGVFTTVLCLISYIFLGFFTVYRTGTFMDRSNHESAPPIIAVIGLGVSRLIEGACVLIPGDLSTKSPLICLVVSGILFVPLLIVFFALFAQKYVHSSNGPAVTLTEEERRAAFAAKYELTRREEEIAYYMSQSRSNGEIAGILQLSESTVRFHVSNILKKTGSSDRNEVSRKYHMG